MLFDPGHATIADDDGLVPSAVIVDEVLVLVVEREDGDEEVTAVQSGS